MINTDKKTITLTSDDGQSQEFDLLIHFSDPDSGKEYAVFTDYTPDSHGGTSLSAASFDPADFDGTIAPIEKDEWDMVYKVLEQFQNELNSQEDGK